MKIPTRDGQLGARQCDTLDHHSQFEIISVCISHSPSHLSVFRFLLRHRMHRRRDNIRRSCVRKRVSAWARMMRETEETSEKTRWSVVSVWNSFGFRSKFRFE